MKTIFCFLLFVASYSASAQDSLSFWQFASSFEANEKGTNEHTWGSETVQYLGTISWKSPSGKELEIRIVTSYRRITEANGFKDQSLIALVKANHEPIKIYDLVSRQNIPIRIENNLLVFDIKGAALTSALPAKFAERFCVEGLTCFDEAVLAVK